MFRGMLNTGECLQDEFKTDQIFYFTLKKLLIHKFVKDIKINKFKKAIPRSQRKTKKKLTLKLYTC